MSDPFGRGGSGSRGGNDPFGRGSGKSHGGGGILGEIEKGAHWVAGKAGLAAHDIKSIPGGLISTGEGLVTHPLRTGEQIAKATLQTLEHPLRDPFMTALTAGGLVSGVGSIAGRAAAVGGALEEGSVGALAKAALKSPAAKTRLLDLGDGKPVPLHPSKNPAVRAGQHVYDKTLERAAKNKPESKLAAHAHRRQGKSLDETARYQQRMRQADADTLDAAARRLSGKKGAGRVNQAAMELTSVNTAPEDAAAYHLAQAEKGVSPERNREVARLYQTVHEKGLLTRNEKGDVVVDAAKHPRLAHVDLALAKVQGRGDEILARYGIRSPEELQSAANAPGRYRAGAKYEKPTPGKEGVPSQTLISARARADRIGALVDKAELKQPGANLIPRYMGGEGDTPRVNALRAAHSLAKEEVQRLEDAAARRQKPTGIVGGESAREARGHVSYASSEKRTPGSPVAASPGPVVGVAKSPITSHANTGYNIEHGLVPADVTGSASRHFKFISRFVNTTERRNAAIEADGRDVRGSTRDVLVKQPGKDHAKITRAVNEALGKEKPTIDEVRGLHAALDAYREEMIPGLADSFGADTHHPVGTTAEDAAAERGLDAPEGYKWVDRGVLGDLAKQTAGPRGRVARSADNINSAVTAATVYFKIGHVGTRVLTNASTNILQGSAKPLEIGKSVGLWKQLTPLERKQALAASGQHGFASMPHEGTSAASRVATKGANWWAKHADAPFRFNSIAYEARKAGFDTPAKFRDLLQKLQDPSKLDAKEAARIDGIAKRANREGIAYDRLSASERQFISRAVWFYPWLRGTVGFAWNTLAEHPYKANALGEAGVAGRKKQLAELGDLPSYEQGLFQLAGGSKPLVADFSTFSPFATPADILQAGARPADLSGFLNPVSGAAAHLAFGLNQYNRPTTHPVTAALSTLFSPTPESQVITALLHRHQDQSKRMFKTTPLSALARTLLGPGTPRRVNLTAAHSSAARERSGR